MKTNTNETRTMTGAELIVTLLERQGIELVAGIPGGSNLPLYDALSRSKIRHILVRHEQAGGFLAQGMARVTGKPAVCLATSGPGVTNLITAIADAKLDSIPIIAITGQVSSSLIGTDAFQEVDTYGMTIPITKHNFLVRSAAELLTVIPEAFRLAVNGRPGPVLIDVPKDVQQQSIEVEFQNETTSTPAKTTDSALLQKAADLINQAKKPLLYVGAGVIHSGAEAILRRISHNSNIPATSSLLGLGIFEQTDPLFLGMLGMHGAPYTNMALTECDALLAIGVRFDDRATGAIQHFCPQARVLHLDIDPAEIDKLKAAQVAITGDIKNVLTTLEPLINAETREPWIQHLQQLRSQHFLRFPAGADLSNPLRLIQAVSSIIPEDSIISTDVGQHQMWVAQFYPFHQSRTLLTSGGLGTMGFGFPAALGAALAAPGKTVISFSGDGSFLMNIQELATLADLQLRVKIIIFNNGYLGLVRQQQELFYQKNYMACQFGSAPNFAAIAAGFGIKSYDLTNDPKAQETLASALLSPGPALINVPIDPALNVLPMVPPGKANHEFIGGYDYE